LWSAIGLHVAGNVVLHHVLGLSGQSSLLTPVFDRPWPATYDPAFVMWLAILAPAVAAAAYWHQRTKGRTKMVRRPISSCAL
jgi:hypothetical protein